MDILFVLCERVVPTEPAPNARVEILPLRLSATKSNANDHINK
jgi:hypothetical protein